MWHRKLSLDSGNLVCNSMADDGKKCKSQAFTRTYEEGGCDKFDIDKNRCVGKLQKKDVRKCWIVYRKWNVPPDHLCWNGIACENIHGHQPNREPCMCGDTDICNAGHYCTKTKDREHKCTESMEGPQVCFLMSFL